MDESVNEKRSAETGYKVNLSNQSEDSVQTSYFPPALSTSEAKMQRAETPLSVSTTPRSASALSRRDVGGRKTPASESSGRRRPESPFQWPSEQRLTSPGYQASTTAFHLPVGSGQSYFRSRRIRDLTTLTKPWTEVKDTKKKWHTIIPAIGLAIGVAGIGALCWQGYSTVINHDYCLVFQDDFKSGTLNPQVWTKEVQVGGFGNGNFEMTTNTDENVFVKDGVLNIKPTLQDEALISQNSQIDLLANGLCTSDKWADCNTATNTTNGTIVNPAKSGRINTKKGGTIQFGRVEVEALLPSGDWLWPAIWLLPVEEKYGAWPASGEIDIAESRGNNESYPLGGRNIISSALHWGPNPSLDSWFHTFIKRSALHTSYAKKWHKFGLEWSDKYIFTYVDQRLRQALYVPFEKPLWPQGHFDSSTQNGTRIVDPWSQTGRYSTPFDQKFYLILNVAVGSTNGWWTDGLAGKPWVDASPSAKKDFWDARNQWYPTWKEGGQMQVRSVKMWQQAGYQGCKGK